MSKELYTHALFKFNVYDSNYYFIPVSELPNGGFSSLYYVTEADARALEEAGTKLNKGTVWSPYLWLDIDTDEGTMDTERRLRLLGLAYTKYDTGNRGAHFKIERIHEPSHNLPKRDKAFVSSNFPFADVSIYTSLNMFRLEGTRHEKTGKIKKAILQYTGIQLSLPEQTVQSESQDNIYNETSSESLFLDPIAMSMTVPYEDGERHNKLMNLGVYLRKIGEPLKFIERWLHHTNMLFEEKLDEGEFNNIIDFIGRVE